MSAELLDAIRTQLPSDCIVTRCREKGCSVDMSCSPEPFILIDVDKASTNQHGRRCDCIFVGGSDESWVVPIELKKGTAKPSEVVRQLEAGARFVDGLIPRNVPVRFRLVVVFKGIKKQQSNELKSRKIKFRGKEVQVNLMRCGDRLADVMKRRLEE